LPFPTHRTTPDGLSRRLQRLDGLPLRPTTARNFIDSLPDATADDESDDPSIGRPHPSGDLDPGWVLAAMRTRPARSALSTIAERPWWPPGTSAGPVSELLDRLWRHSVAVGIVARRLAREAGDPDPDDLARAGQLCGLGYWAVAAVEPGWLVNWWNQDDPAARQKMERTDLGSDLFDLGRRLAERWGCSPLLAEAAWLHADRDGSLNLASASTGRLQVIQEAYRWAEWTPWSLSRPIRESLPNEPRLRILVAEVQARCGGPFVDPAATPYEERTTRQNARLRLELFRLRRAHGHAERLLELLADSCPGETPEEWADRAARAWCAAPGVGAARVRWLDDRRTDIAPSAGGDHLRAPNVSIPIDGRGPSRAVAELWCQEEAWETHPDRMSQTSLRAWDSWAALLADRSRLERRLQAVVASLRDRVHGEEERLRQGKLDALGEFAAGAGHELNNPLAVIVGRAQLLLARAEDPEIGRSLRIILGQAQRAHRILRDLMFVARPPLPRLRLYKPPEVLESVLAEFERESQARGVRLHAELEGSTPASWGDADGLRHLAEILLRNALQATAPGGRIVVRSSHKDGELTWSFSDNGKGIGAAEADHLFDPFYCGRQAGRGLGLGLPRAAKIVEQAGGKLRWSSSPGHETIFQVHLPLTRPPEPEGNSRGDGQPEDRRPQLMLRT
jgi:signal transduction histidine kinase